MKVRWDMDYEFNLPDQNCVYNLRFGFEDLATGIERDSFSVVGTTDNDEEDLSKSGSIFVPIHMRLKVRAKLTERPGGIFPGCSSIAESEAWIKSLKLTFDHPGTSESNKEVTIVGYREGRGTVFDLHRWDNVAWEQPNLANEDFRIYYDGVGDKEHIKIENATGNGSTDGDVGNFRKRVHLLD